MKYQQKDMLRFEELKAEILTAFNKAEGISKELGKTGLDVRQLFKETKNGEQRLQQGNFRVGVIGRFRIGKSTFLNALLGGRILKEQEAGGVCTAIVTKITTGDVLCGQVCYHSAEEMYEIFLNTCQEAEFIPDMEIFNTRQAAKHERLDIADFRQANIQLLQEKKARITEASSRNKQLIEFALYILNEWERFKPELNKIEQISPQEYEALCTDRARAPFIKEVKFSVPSMDLAEDIVLMDTPGLGAPNWDENITIKYLQDCHAAIHLLLPPAGFEAIDANLITYLKRKQPHVVDKLIFCINRSDEVSSNAREQIKAHVAAELRNYGIQEAPVLFLCSKLPFLIQLRQKGLPLSEDELEYMDFALYKFRLPQYGEVTAEKVFEVCGFDTLKNALDHLLATGRAQALLQEGHANLCQVCDEIENHLNSQVALVEKGEDGEFRLIERIEEAIALVEYEKNRAEKEVALEFYRVQGKIRNWVAPYLIFKQQMKSERWIDEKLSKSKADAATQPNQLELSFFGFPVQIRDFKYEIDLMQREIYAWIDEFWCWENFSRSTEAAGAGNTADAVISQMRDAFLPKLTAMVQNKLESPVDGVKSDMDEIYKKAFEKMKTRLSGLTDELIVKLNKILHFAFKPVDLGDIRQSLDETLKTQERLRDLGRASGLWENLIELFFSIAVSDQGEKETKTVQLRINRINKELKIHLHRELFPQLTYDLASYIQEVVDNLMKVMRRELDSRMDEISTQSIVAKFGASREQIEVNIKLALRRKSQIEQISAQYAAGLKADLQKIEAELAGYGAEAATNRKESPVLRPASSGLNAVI